MNVSLEEFNWTKIPKAASHLQSSPTFSKFTPHCQGQLRSPRTETNTCGADQCSASVHGEWANTQKMLKWTEPRAGLSLECRGRGASTHKVETQYLLGLGEQQDSKGETKKSCCNTESRAAGPAFHYLPGMRWNSLNARILSLQRIGVDSLALAFAHNLSALRCWQDKILYKWMGKCTAV